jgi:hypothetical protein
VAGRLAQYDAAIAIAVLASIPRKRPGVNRRVLMRRAQVEEHQRVLKV